MMNFEQAFEKLLSHEGGYVNDRRDPGGETRYGISKRSYPNEDIAGMTLERAKLIYHRDYWLPSGCEVVPDALKLQLFDMSVNSGVKAAIKAMQQAACVPADGVIGPQTLTAIRAMQPARFVARFNGVRLAFMAGMAQWPAFSRGWALRIADNLLEA
jgi:lysozyme family protein